MVTGKTSRGLVACSLLICTGCISAKETPAAPVKQVEHLDRGVVVIPTENGNVVSWRLLVDDPESVTFNVYRNGQKLNNHKLAGETFYLDEGGSANDVYSVGVHQGRGGSGLNRTGNVPVWDAPYLSIPLNKPEDDWVVGTTYTYSANDASVADLTGDGRYEIIIKWYPSNSNDNLPSFTGKTMLDAYTLEGEQLWRIDLGQNIRSGAHYTQFLAYDFDGDGRAEIALKTADGTIDGVGTVIGDADADWRNDGGMILDGPEYLTMFDGLTGEALDTIDYIPQRGTVSDWGDNYGNRVDRFLAGVGYLDGEHPSMLFSRGYYTRAVIAAFDWENGKFQSRWVFDSDDGGDSALAFGQGAHSLSIGDVDADGMDEIVFGAATIDHDGTLLYSTELGHGDALHMSDIDPNRPGMEIFMVHESAAAYTKGGIEYGVELHDAATGEILWHRPSNGADVGRGLSADIDPNYPGMESYGTRGGLVAADGTVISNIRPGPINFVSWWDGDLTRELLDNITISKWDPELLTTHTLLDGSLYDVGSNNGTKATPSLSADIFGDWREEVMWRSNDSTELKIFSTTEPTTYRIPTLMQEPQYRVAIAWQNVGYNQPPHPAFYLGSDTTTIPDYGSQVLPGNPDMRMAAHASEDALKLHFYNPMDKISDIALYRSTLAEHSDAELIITLPGQKSFFVDTDVEADVTYYYTAEVNVRGNGNRDGQREPVVLEATGKLAGSEIPQIRTWHQSSELPVTLSWHVRNLNVAAVNVFRSAADDSGVADFTTSEQVARLENGETEWTDAGAAAGSAHYYWLQFEGAEGEVILSDAIFAERFLVPLTNLTAERVEGGIHLTWSLEDFPQGINRVEIYRNTSARLPGRGRVIFDAPLAGELTDSTGLVEGTTYWYMFKLTMADGTTFNTEPESPVTY